jgi:Bifunctional DNA primase/polymerase, N-terminal
MTAAERHAVEPYAESAAAYVTLDYSPVPVKGKHPPLKGYTGWRGRYVDALEARRLAQSHGAWNVGLRLHDGVIGVDVEGYAGGLDTLAALEAELGPLPPTVMSTARSDGSAIRLFRRPVGWHLSGDMGVGIQVVQASHRYVMSASSIHPTLGLPYRWLVNSGPCSPSSLPVSTMTRRRFCGRSRHPESIRTPGKGS